MRKNILTTILFLYAFYGCANGAYNKSAVYFSMKFPQNNFAIKAIPPQTKKIDVDISSSYSNEREHFSLSPQNASKVIYLTDGIKTIKAVAFDERDRALASDEVNFGVLYGKRNTVILTLKVDPNIVLESPEPTPNETPKETPIQPSNTPSTTQPTGTPSPSSSNLNPNLPGPTPTPSQNTSSNLSGGSSGGGNPSPTPTPSPATNTIEVNVEVEPDTTNAK